MLEPDRDQLEIFVDAIFRHAGVQGFVAVRSFYEGADKPFRISGTSLAGGPRFLVDVAEDDARRAAQSPKPVVFCPPLAVFTTKDRAREQDIIAGLALSVECDQHPQEARERLEQLLGPATVVVKSGGRWTNGSGEEDKLHLHWRLAQPARGDDLARLKQARDLAARLVGGDPSNKPVCHPIRWPGSWHRKAEPRLCEIDTLYPDREIDLDAALEVLIKATPAPAAKAGHDSTAGNSDPEDWPKLVADIVTGASYHQPLVSLSARLVGANVLDGSVVKLLRGLMAASAAPHDEQRWQSRYDSIPRIVNSAREKYGAADSEPTPPPIAAKPYEWREPEQITRRAWLYGRHYMRRFVSTTIGRPGLGKTNLAITETLDMVSAGAILDHHRREPLSVWYIGEDPAEEIERRFATACAFHHLRPDDVVGRLFTNSTLELPALRIAHKGQRGPIVSDAILEALAGEMAARKVDVLILDPLIEFHSVEESNPSEMGGVMRALAALASRTNAAIEVLHHTRKQAPGVAAAATIDDGRGASSIIGVARSARLLNPMAQTEATLAGIAEGDRWRYARLDSGKANMAPPAATQWVQHVSELLPCGESVGVVAAWNFPDAFAGFSANDVPRIRELARGGPYRRDPQSPEWFGYAVAAMLNLDINDKATRARIGQMIKTWLKTKALDIEIREDAGRRDRKYIVPGPFRDTVEPLQ